MVDEKVVKWLGKNNEIGIDIWEKKYRHNNESFDEWLDRVSGGDNAVREEIEAKRFIFGGRILANRGLYKEGLKVTYSNCYVLPPPEDSIESIYDTASKLARTFSYGGGVGIDISNLAPKGAMVNNTAKETSGAVSFMDLYGMTTSLIGQNGRRGALMISIACDHPDIEEFIDIKSDLDKVTTANISVRVTNSFMEAVERNEDITLSYERPEVNQTITKTVNARKLFKKLAYNNWDMGEPGILFWDRINSWNLLSEDDEFEYAGTNPCAEEPLPAGGSCLLGSINLSEFVINPYNPFSESHIDFEKLEHTVAVAVKALNDVLDEGLPLHPLEIQREAVRDWRQIGLGVFGIADMLIKLGVEYGSEASLKVCRKVAQTIAKTAIIVSSDLARENDEYPKFNEKVLDSPYFNFVMKDMDKYKALVMRDGLRNSQLLTIAPTGTLSTMLQVSGGIEPYYATSWQRTTKSLHGEDVVYTERPKAIKELMEVMGISDDGALPKYVVTSSTIHPMDRINMQSIWQMYVDASISSTINLPNKTTPEEVEKIYMEAWKAGLKGITVFRDGCRRVGILSTGDDEEDNDTPTEIPRGIILDVSDDLISAKRTIRTGCGKLYMHLDFDEVTGEPMETFVECGSGGGCERNLTFISRLMSLALRGGIPIESIIDQAMSIKPCKAYCDRTKLVHDTSKGTSCPSALGNAMLDLYDKIQNRVFDDSDSAETDYPHESLPYEETPDMLVDCCENGEVCPECGAKIVYEGGCNICKSCGWSRCG